MKRKMQLTDQTIIKQGKPEFALLDKLCFLSKNCYNAALYIVRQKYKEDKSYLDYFKVNKVMHDSHNPDYFALPYTQMAQQVLRQVDSTYTSFFRSMKSTKMRGKRVHVPSYKDKENGRNVVVYTNQTFKAIDGKIRLKVDRDGTFIYIPTKRKDIQQVRIVPKGNHIVVEVIYNVEYELKGDNGRYASIDLGVSNVCTLASNAGQSVIFNGRQLKSVNAWYNKRKAKLQHSLLEGKRTSRRIKRLSGKRNRKVKDMMHKLTSQIVEHMKANSYNILVIGKNRGWKDGASMSKVSNQNFVSIPYNMLIQMLEYKCHLAGIEVICVNEAYTSKCSFFDREKVCKHTTYKGRRVKRGLFITGNGVKVNADVNGALNILTLGLKRLNVKLDVLDFILRPEHKRLVLSPIFRQISLK